MKRSRMGWMLLSALVGCFLLVSAYSWARETFGDPPIPLGPFSPRATRTVEDVLKSFGPDADARLKPAFERAGLPYPPKDITLLGFKEEKRLELWAQHKQAWVFVTAFPILAASGEAGPKLREGDRQVPEGIYRIESLNPNSRFHLSLKLNYPNAFDRAQARRDGRDKPGSDIFIHGRAVSIGCLAMGDAVAEQLFVLVARMGIEHVKVILAPRDFRRTRLEPPTALESSADIEPAWLPTLYAEIDAALQPYGGQLAGPMRSSAPPVAK